MSARTIRIDILPDFPAGSAAQGDKPLPRGVKPDSSAAAVPDHSLEFEILLQSIYDAVLISDMQGTIVKLNGRALSFFLCSEKELQGTSVIDRILGADDTLIARVRENLEHNQYTLIEANCIRMDESMFPSEIAVNNIRFNDRDHMCFFVRDITVRKQVEDKLKAYDKARSQFVSNVSHELKTPLTSMIYAIANMLHGVVGPLSPEITRYLKLLEGNCKRLCGTIEDILDISRLDSNTLKLLRTKVPMLQLVRWAVDLLGIQARQKKQTLTIAAGKRQWFVDCDSQKIERVLLNILGNAVKFTPGGGQIDVVVQDDPGRPGYVLVSVRDTGGGIPADAIDKVTMRYFTVGEQPAGSGLGLAISKEIVELHGGQIGIESPPHGQSRGTLVSVSLPAAAPPVVLVAIQDAAERSEIERQLSACGFQLVLAGNGRDAWQAIQSHSVDLALLDARLPDMDWAAFLNRLRAEPKMAGVAVVLIAESEPDAAECEIFENYSASVWPRPLKIDELQDQIDYLLIQKHLAER